MITLEANVVTAVFHGVQVTIHSGKKDWVIVYQNKNG